VNFRDSIFIFTSDINFLFQSVVLQGRLFFVRESKFSMDILNIYFIMLV